MTDRRPQVEPTLELLHSYNYCIKALEKERDEIDAALACLRERRAEHMKEHGFTGDGLGEDAARSEDGK